MNPFLNRFIRLFLPLLLEYLDQTLNQKKIKEGRRDVKSKKTSRK